MTQVSANGNTYSDDGSTSKDMRSGGFRTWLLAMLSHGMGKINQAIALTPSSTYTLSVPTTGQTVTTASGEVIRILDPAGTLATLTVTMPPSATDGQVFELQSSQAITALTINPAAGQSVKGGAAFLMTANGGVSWRFRSTNTTWYRRY